MICKHYKMKTQLVQENNEKKLGCNCFLKFTRLRLDPEGRKWVPNTYLQFSYLPGKKDNTKRMKSWVNLG